MKKWLSFFISALFSLFLITTVFAEEVTLLGPETFLQETSAPITKKMEFFVPNAGKATMRVINGFEDSTDERVSSAAIALNNALAFGPNSFNQDVTLLEKTVSLLKGKNWLSVGLFSKSKGRISVSITAPSAITSITAVPDGFPVNTPTQVNFTAAVPYSVSGPVPPVELIQVSQVGDVINTEGEMVDDGNLSLGDEIQGDGVFSFRKTYTILQPSDVLLRVKANLNGQVFYSNVFTLTAFTPISDNEATVINNIQVNAEQLYYQLLPTKGKDQALTEVVTFLKAQSFVQDAGISEGASSVWIKYINGMEGGISFNPPGTRGGSLPTTLSATSNSESTMGLVVGGQSAVQMQLASSGKIEVQSKKVLILSPFLDEFAPTDEGAELKTLYDQQNCPTYDGISGRPVYLSNSQAGVGTFKALGSYGIVHIASHGSVNNNRVVVYTKTSNSAQNLKTYQTDVQKGRLTIETITGRTWLAVTPSFFTYYIKSMPSSLVFFSSCFSTFNNSMASALQAKGAKTYLGFSNLVPSKFAYDKAKYFHQSWVEDPTTLVTTGEVFNNGCSGGACWNLLGANNLEAPSGRLQNGGFESGVLGAWTAAGDGRVLSQLGQFSPVEGSFLNIVSTGLGFTTTSGSIEQKICLPTNAQKLEFHWNFDSEEFVEWCGSSFQDTFSVDMITSTGTQNLFSRKVDDLCDMVSPSNLKFDQSQGACTPTDGVGFGTGGNDCTVWTTDWKSESIDITGIATANQNKAVTLRFSSGDVGDSIFDSAVLLDDIKVTTP